jgi:NDP-sugar pyrophosphorylase family protein
LKLLVLVGGFGTRLQALFPDTPKALVPVGEEVFLTLQLLNWISQGVRSFVFLLHYKHEIVTEFLINLKDGILRDCELVFLVEEVPLGTGGAVANAVFKLGLEGNFLLTNADTWIGGSAFVELTSFPSPAIAVTFLKDSGRYGQVEFNECRAVTAFKEKSAIGVQGWVSAGLSWLDADIFKSWEGNRFSIEENTFPDLVRRGQLTASPIQADFIDIGIPEDYKRFCCWVKNDKRGKLSK